MSLGARGQVHRGFAQGFIGGYIVLNVMCAVGGAVIRDLRLMMTFSFHRFQAHGGGAERQGIAVRAIVVGLIGVVDLEQRCDQACGLKPHFHCGRKSINGHGPSAN